MNDTIAAIATPTGAGGIGIVRISGVEAAEIADQVARTARGERISKMAGYTCAYGRVYDGDVQLDEAVITVFRAPHSYTGEDTVELAVHGGVYLVQRLLASCCAAGARPADAGEFTRRAFLNGKLDLTRAEAVADLIAARGKQAARAALTARDGALYHAVAQTIGALTTQAGHLAAWIDYPEEEIAEINADLLKATLVREQELLARLLATYDSGRVIREGIETVIVGKPNAGKSTLMNLLAGETRSIVADLAGTTRDVVSDTVQLGEILLRLSDTAGMRESGDAIEMAGVEMAGQRLQRAQLVLAVFDGSQPLDEDDRRVISLCSDAAIIPIVNKNDLPQQLDTEALHRIFGTLFFLTASTGAGKEELQAEITRLFALDQFDPAAANVANERQRVAVSMAHHALQEAIDALVTGVSYDAVAVCIEDAIDRLLILTGKRASQSVVDEVFARFCVGK